MEKLRNFFKKFKVDLHVVGDDKMMEVELWDIEDEPINSDEVRAWEIIKEINQDILFEDKQWHFFYENFYNIIRCSNKFYPKVIKKLKKLDIGYIEKGEWIDGQWATRKYQDVYKGMFHSFTMLALKEYDINEFDSIYDRVSHCFFNHQFYISEQLRAAYGRQWESHLMSRAAVYRAEHTGLLFRNGIDASIPTGESKEEIEKKIRQDLGIEEDE